MTWHDVAIAALLVDLLWRVGKGMYYAYLRVSAKMALEDYQAGISHGHVHSHGQDMPDMKPSVRVFSFTDDNGRKH